MSESLGVSQLSYAVTAPVDPGSPESVAIEDRELIGGIAAVERHGFCAARTGKHRREF